MNPLISIIIPTFNRARLIAEALESVVYQKYTNWECLIVDDGSTDDTLTVVSKFSDSRIHYYNRPANRKKGASSCRNFGLEMARGELIQFLDDDDLLDKEKLYEQVKVFSSNEELLTCKWGGFLENSNLKGLFKYRYNSYKDFRRGIYLLNTFGLYDEFFPIHVYLTPRTLIHKAGEWNEELSNNDDAEFFSRVILAASKIKFVPGAKVFYRHLSPQKLSALDSAEKIKSLISSWRLIEEALKTRGYPAFYVHRAKQNFYNFFSKESPSIITQYENFFNGRKNYDSPIFVFYKKMKTYLEQRRWIIQ